VSDYGEQAKNLTAEADKLDGAALQAATLAMSRAASDAARACRELADAFIKLDIQIKAMAKKAKK